MNYAQETLEGVEETLEELYDYLQDQFGPEANGVRHKIEEALGSLRSARDAAEQKGL